MPPEGSQHPPKPLCTHQLVLLWGSQSQAGGKRERIFHLNQRQSPPLNTSSCTAGTGYLMRSLRAQAHLLQISVESCLIMLTTAWLTREKSCNSCKPMGDVSACCVSCRSSCSFKREAWEGHWRDACISLMFSLQKGWVPGCCKTSLRELICNSRQGNSLLPETLSSFYLWELGKQRAAQYSVWWVFDPWLLHVSHLNNVGKKTVKAPNWCDH